MQRGKCLEDKSRDGLTLNCGVVLIYKVGLNKLDSQS